MIFKEALKRILYYASVPKCVSCDQKLDYDDRGLCKACMEIYRQHKLRDCSRCAKILSQCTCSSFMLKSHSVKQMIKVCRYSRSEQSRPSNYLIYSLKQDNREDVISFLQDELTEALKNNIKFNSKKYIFTNVPRRKKSILNFGFDHSAVLAKRIAESLGVEYRQFLVARSKKAQKSTHGLSRITNAQFDYKRNIKEDLKGKTVIIVDDVATTGASISKCAMLLKGLGAKKIIGAVIAIAYKDSYIPFAKDHI